MSEREFHKDLEMFLMQLSIYSYEGRDPFAKGLCADALASIPQWIPVSEELPPESEGVVVWDAENRIAAVAYRWVSVIDGKSNYTMTAGDGYGFSEYAVTHWMPLPEPPEVK